MMKHLAGCRALHPVWYLCGVLLLVTGLTQSTVHAQAPLPESSGPNLVLRNPVDFDAVIQLPLSQAMGRFLPSLGNGQISARDLIDDYKANEILSRTPDVCKVLQAAENWIPTAATKTVPPYVALAAVVSEADRKDCKRFSFTTVPLRVDMASLRAVAGVYPTLAAAVPPQGGIPALAAPKKRDIIGFNKRATVEKFPNVLSLGAPVFYYLRDYVPARDFASQLKKYDRSDYLVADFAFTAREPRPGASYDLLTFSVRAQMGNGEQALPYIMVPEQVKEEIGTRQKTFTIKPSIPTTSGGNVPIGEAAWSESIHLVASVITSFGIREPQFSWEFRPGQTPIRGSQRLLAVLRLPTNLAKTRLVLALNIEGNIGQQRFIWWRHDEPVVLGQCVVVGLQSGAPVGQPVSECAL